MEQYRISSLRENEFMAFLNDPTIRGFDIPEKEETAVKKYKRVGRDELDKNKEKETSSSFPIFPVLIIGGLAIYFITKRK